MGVFSAAILPSRRFSHDHRDLTHLPTPNTISQPPTKRIETMNATATKTKVTAPPMIHVPKNVLCIGKVTNDARTEMAHVHVVREQGGKMRAESTDGRRALLVEWHDEFLIPDVPADVMIPSDLAVQIDKVIPKDDPHNPAAEVSVSEHDTGKQIEARVQNPSGAITFTAGSPSDPFPDLRDVIPTGNGLARTAMGLDLLIGLLQTMKAAGADVVRIVIPANEKRATKFIGIGAPRKITAVQMPVSTDGGDDDPKRDLKESADAAFNGTQFQVKSASDDGKGHLEVVLAQKPDPAVAPFAEVAPILDLAAIGFEGLGDSIDWSKVTDKPSRKIPTALAFVVKNAPYVNVGEIKVAGRDVACLCPVVKAEVWPGEAYQGSEAGGRAADALHYGRTAMFAGVRVIVGGAAHVISDLEPLFVAVAGKVVTV